MSKKSFLALIVSGSLLAATSAWADHNSPNGAGSANMPNDIHNTAIEDGTDALIDLVQYGDGADSVNRYDTDTDTTTMGGSSTSGGSTMGGGARQMGRR